MNTLPAHRAGNIFCKYDAKVNKTKKHIKISQDFVNRNLYNIIISKRRIFS